jgi:Trk K+ transport system NAD-binding subunit
MTPRNLQRPHRLRIYLRYAGYLLWEFRWALGVFCGLVLGVGLLLHWYYHAFESGRALSFAEACYGVFLAVFLESYLPFPQEWFLQPLFFLVPVIGLGAVADSLVRLGYLMFTRKQRLPEWQQMVASLYRNHVVVAGVGKVGYEIVKGLLEMREPVVAVERQGAESSLLEELIDLDVPVIRGDARTRKTLEQAGVARARSVVFATSDDLTNLDGGLTARDLNTKAQVVLRLFDESLAAKVRGAFAIPAISTSRVSAPAFIAAATGRRIYQDFQLAGQMLHLIDMTIASGSGLAGQTVGAIQKALAVNVVMHSGRSGVNINPPHDLMLAEADEMLVVAPVARLVELEAVNRGDDPQRHDSTSVPVPDPLPAEGESRDAATVV